MGWRDSGRANLDGPGAAAASRWRDAHCRMRTCWRPERHAARSCLESIAIHALNSFLRQDWPRHGCQGRRLTWPRPSAARRPQRANARPSQRQALTKSPGAPGGSVATLPCCAAGVRRAQTGNNSACDRCDRSAFTQSTSPLHASIFSVRCDRRFPPNAVRHLQPRSCSRER